MGGAVAARGEGGSDHLRVCDVDTEGDRGGARAQPRIFLDRDGDDDAARHGTGEVVEGEVAGSGAHAGEVEPLRRRVGNEAGEITLGDQLGNAGAEDDREIALLVWPQDRLPRGIIAGHGAPPHSRPRIQGRKPQSLAAENQRVLR